MPKILFTATIPSVYGAGRMAASVALELKRIGHEVQFAYERRLRKDELSIADELESEGIATHHIPRMSSELFPFLIHPLSALIRKEGFDLVMSSQLRDAAPAMAAARRQKSKAILVCMNLPNFTGNYFVRNTKKRIYQKAAAYIANHVVVVAPAIQEELINSFDVPSNKISVVPCGLDLDSIPQASCSKVDKLKAELGLENSSFVAVNLARIHRQKGQDVLIESLGLLHGEGKLSRGFRMIFVGGPESAGSERLLVQLKDSVKRLGIEEHVNFVGFREDYRNFLYLADTFILPSRWEGLPLVVLEAFAAKVPVIMTEYGKRFEKFQQDSDGVYVAKESPAELASAIETMILRSTNERRSIGENGFNYLKQNLTLKSSLEKFSQLVDQILGCKLCEGPAPTTSS